MRFAPFFIHFAPDFFRETACSHSLRHFLPKCIYTCRDGRHQKEQPPKRCFRAPQVRYGRCVNLRFSTEAALQAAVNDLFGSNARHRQLNLGGRQVARYFVNKTHNTLLLILE